MVSGGRGLDIHSEPGTTITVDSPVLPTPERIPSDKVVADETYALVGSSAASGENDKHRGDQEPSQQVAAHRGGRKPDDSTEHIGAIRDQEGRHGTLRRRLARRVEAGDEYAAALLLGLLGEEALAHRADTGDEQAALRLAELLAEREDIEGLTRRADSGDRSAKLWLAELLAERGRPEELTRLADAGEQSAAFRLACLLAEWGDVEGG